jgi:hypothetical protein
VFLKEEKKKGKLLKKSLLILKQKELVSTNSLIGFHHQLLILGLSFQI